MSLDGYIARLDDSVDWLDSIEGSGDNGYKVFYNTVDTLIMGRRTYDWVSKHTETNPYNGKTTYVITSSKQEDQSDVKFTDNPVELIKTIKKQTGKDIWLVGGGKAVHSLMDHNLVDEFIITIAPIVLGSGIQLFQGQQADLVQTKITAFNQFTQIHYRIKE